MIRDERLEVLAALSDNALEIQRTAIGIVGALADAERQSVLNTIANLRKFRAELEAKLAALGQPSAAHLPASSPRHSLL